MERTAPLMSIGSRLRLPAAAAGLVAWKTGLLPRLGLGVRGRVIANASIGVGAVVLARARGYGWEELGLAREYLPRGLRTGAVAAGLALGGYGLATAIPLFRRHLSEVVTDLRLPEITEWALVHVPLGTVVAEELAFRSVLHAVAKDKLSPPAESTLQAVAFGMWHAYPAPHENRLQPGVVLATGIGGLLLTRLRTKSGSVLAPVLLHLAVNSGAVLVGALVSHLDDESNGEAN